MNNDYTKEASALLSEGVNLAFLFEDGRLFCSDGKGISDLLSVSKTENSLRGAIAADKIVGRAAALLYVRCKPKFLYAETLSEGGKRILERADICFSHRTLTPSIMNRKGTDICPMDDAVKDISDTDTKAAYRAISNRLKELRAAK